MNILNNLLEIANEHHSRAKELNDIIVENIKAYGTTYMNTMEYAWFKRDISVHMFWFSLIVSFVKLFR